MSKEYAKHITADLKKIEDYCMDYFMPKLEKVGWCNLTARWNKNGDSLTAYDDYTYQFSIDTHYGIRFTVNKLMLGFGDEYCELNIYNNLAHACELISEWANARKILAKNLLSLAEHDGFIKNFSAAIPKS